VSFKEKWFTPRGVFLLCFALLFLRACPRLFHADIWGEDALYLSEGLQFGARSLLIPFAGVFHLLERAVLLTIANILPVSLWAIAVTWIWTFAAAYVFSLFSRREYGWLLESDRARAILCLLFCLTPGLNEMLGNMANVNWIAVLYLMLILIRSPDSSPKSWECAISVVIFFSVGTSITLVPLLTWRIVHSLRRGRRPYAEGFLFLMIVVCHAVFIAIKPHLVAMGDTYTFGGIPTWNEFLEQGILAFRNTLSRSGLVRPWLGSGLASKIVDGPAIGLVGCWLCLAFVPYVLKWRKNERDRTRFWVVILFSISFFLWLVPAFMARTGALVVFLKGGYWHYRYAFPLSIGATAFWFLSLPQVDRRRFAFRSALGVFCVLNFLHGLDRFFICAYAGCSKPSQSWFHRSKPLADRLAGTTRDPVHIDVFPTGWAVKLP
jgi:hypothetical protein